MNRRNFIQTTGLSAAGLSLAGTGLANSILAPRVAKRPICAFTKCLQFLSFEEIGEVLSILGFDGADITLRPGGQVEPVEAKTALPLAIRALEKNNISIPMVVTSITNPTDPLSISTLQALADTGIKFYRMGWMKYEESKDLRKTCCTQRKTGNSR